MKFFAVMAVMTEGGGVHGWQGEWEPMHRGITRQDAFWDVMGKLLNAADIPEPIPGRPQMVIPIHFSLEPQELPR